MKFSYDFESGKIYFERERMSEDRFESICFLSGIGITLYFVYSLFALIAR